jgi:hypothetical protein
LVAANAVDVYATAEQPRDHCPGGGADSQICGPDFDPKLALQCSEGSDDPGEAENSAATENKSPTRCS